MLALRLLEKGYGGESHSWAVTTLASVATKCYSAIKDEYRLALQLDKPRREISGAARELRKDAVFGQGSYSLANDDAALLADLVRIEFYSGEPEEYDAAGFLDYGDLFLDAHLPGQPPDLTISDSRTMAALSGPMVKPDRLSKDQAGAIARDLDADVEELLSRDLSVTRVPEDLLHGASFRRL